MLSAGPMPCPISRYQSPFAVPRSTPACFHRDRKSTRLNSSHGYISYAVFCLKKKNAIVSYAVEQNCAGIECMSGIPGTVGGTPVQNVGAYGQEVADTITSVRDIDTTSDHVRD